MKIKLIRFASIIALISGIAGCDDRTTSSSISTETTIIYPPNGATVGDSITVKVSPGEISNVTRIDLYINGDSMFTDTNSPYRFFWSTHNVTSGEYHTLYAIARTADSLSVSDTITVQVQLASGFHLISEFQTTGSAVTIVPDETGGYVYVAASDAGVKIYDITNLYSPEFASEINTTASAVAVEVWGNYLFVAESGDGVSVWDISDPTDPDEVHSYDTPGNAINLEFDPSDSVLYVADDDALQIIKLDDNFQMQPLAGLASATSVNDVTINGNYAHLGTADGLRIVNISNPSNPIYVSGGIYNTSTATLGIESNGTLDYMANGSGGFAIISIESLSNPLFKVDFDTPGNVQATAFQSGGAPDKIYVADGSEGISVYRYSDNGTAELTDLHQFETQGSTYDIVYQNGLIFVADNSRFMIMRYVE